MNDQFAKFVELANRSADLQAEWLQRILTLAAGGLALLAGLNPSVPDPPLAKYLLVATWFFLGLGILAGGSATYLEVNRAKNLTQNFREELLKKFEEGPPMTAMPPIFGGPHRFFQISRTIMVVSLILAVISLSGFSIIKTLNA